MAAQKKLTEYERRRLENIKRNNGILASLKIHSKVNELSQATKPQRPQIKPFKIHPEKKLKTEDPVVIRKSLRTRGIEPDPSTADGLKDDFDETLRKTPKPKSSPCPISMRDAYCGDASDHNKFTETILGVSKMCKFCCSDASEEGVNTSPNFGCPIRVWGSVVLGSLRLKPENIARVVPGTTTSARFFPSLDMKMIAVGNKSGHLGFWNFDAKPEDGDGIYLYQPHSGQVSAIIVQPFSISKVYTSCYDGFIRLMDVEKEVFDLVHASESAIYSMSQRANDAKCLLFSQGQGVLNSWDERVGKPTFSWTLHEDRISSIDFSSENSNIMATSSTDGTVCFWDLRNIETDKPKSLKTFGYKMPVRSAYFSPSGSCVATSVDDKVVLLTGDSFEYIHVVYNHNQKTGRWVSSFRAIWGWDNSYIFVGSMKRGVDVISTAQQRSVVTLQSPEISAVPCIFDAHPYKVGTLAGATNGGQVYIWTTH